MSWIEKLRQKPQAAKLRIIWAVAIAITILLIIIWVISANFQKKSPQDTTLFQTIDQGLKDVKDNFKK